MYTMHDIENDKYNTIIKDFGSSNVVTCMSMQNPFELDVLNAASDRKTPVLSYNGGITTLKYENYNNVTASVHSNASFSNTALKAFGLDSSN